jgi:hypothetical protein
MNIYTFQNDIAMVRMKSNRQQVLIARARQTPNITESVDPRPCLIYGYGSTNEHFNVLPNRIHYARANLLSYKKCESIVGRVIAPNEGTGQICAMGMNNADACDGKFIRF